MSLKSVFFAKSLVMLLLVFSSPAWAENAQYTCPMHLHIISDTQGSCPICGMDLVPVEVDADDTSDQTSSVKISPEVIQNIGVRTQKAKIAEFGNEVRSYGIIAINERLQKRVYSRVDGWITKLGVSANGDDVAEKDHLYTIHSPDLVLAQQDLLSIEKRGASSKLSKLFVHYQVDDRFVESLRKTKKINKDVPYYSAYSGTVSKLNVRPGSYVTMNDLLMVLEDYSSVWVNVNVAEKDLHFIKKASNVRVVLPNSQGLERVGTVDYIYPTVDTASRTGQIRIVLDNADGALKPGAYADVEFTTDVVKRLSVASEAVLQSSDGYSVIIAQGEGRFQPQKVKVGITSKGRTEIISGINEGDNIVVSSQFLIDSESSLREAFRKMRAPKGEK